MCSQCGNINCANCSISVNQLQGPAGAGITNIVRNENGDIIVTLTNGVIINAGNIADGTNGTNGQSIHHISLTSGSTNPGSTATYTIWANVGETISLGTFTVYNGTNGTNGTNGLGISTITLSPEYVMTITYTNATQVTFSLAELKGSYLLNRGSFSSFNSFSTPTETRHLIGEISLPVLPNNTFYDISIDGKLRHDGTPKPALELQLNDLTNSETIGLLINTETNDVDFNLNIHLIKYGTAYFYRIIGILGSPFQLLTGGSPHITLYNTKWNPIGGDCSAAILATLKLNGITNATTGTTSGAIQIRNYSIQHINS